MEQVTEDMGMGAEKKSNGALVGSIIIVVILIIGGIYLWKNSTREVAPENTETAPEITSVEAELNDINLDDLDAEI